MLFRIVMHAFFGLCDLMFFYVIRGLAALAGATAPLKEPPPVGTGGLRFAPPDPVARFRSRHPKGSLRSQEGGLAGPP